MMLRVAAMSAVRASRRLTIAIPRVYRRSMTLHARYYGYVYFTTPLGP